MALSGTKEYKKNTTTLVEDSFHKLGILSEGESITAFQRKKAERSLNMMIQGWEADGVHLWKYGEAILFLEKSVQSYDLGNDIGNATEDTPAETTLSADAVLGASSIDVVSASGILDGDNIGIELDDGTAQWTTVNGTPIGTNVVLTDVLTGASSSGNQVKAYTNKITKPVKISQIRFVSSETNEIECREYSRTDYFRLANKTSQGNSTQYYYNPQRKSTKLYVWPTASETFKKLKINYYGEFDIFNAPENEPDFPNEWYETLVYNLAERIAPSYGFNEDHGTYKTIARKANELYEKLKAFDTEDTSVRILSTDTTGILNVR